MSTNAFTPTRDNSPASTFATVTGNEKISLTRDCIQCGATATVVGKYSAYKAWKDGVRSSADAFRRLDAPTRTLLTTLICAPCFEQA